MARLSYSTELARGDMILPSRLIVYSAAFALDGGTLYLMAKDEKGRERSIKLVQHGFPRRRHSCDDIPGRLYFDDNLVPMRSIFETGVMSLLKSAKSRSPDEFEQTMTQVIEFVESDEYLRFPERIEQAADATLYDVWVAWDAGNRKYVIVRLSGYLGVGLRAAVEMLEQHRPIAEGITALDVSDLAERYRKAGMSVRVSPEFRWRLP
jgi:ribosomal protein L7/L12